MLFCVGAAVYAFPFAQILSLDLFLSDVPLLESIQEPLALEHEHDLMHAVSDAGLLHVHDEVCLFWLLVRVIDPGEALDLAPPGLGVDAPLVRALGMFQRRGDVHQIEASECRDGVARLPSAGLVGRDRRRNHGRTGLGQLGRDEGDALDVGVASVVRESEFGRQLRSDRLAQEQGDGSTALLVEGNLQGSRDRVLAAVLESRQEDGEALLEPCWVRFAQHLDHLGVGEPFGDVLSRAQATAKLCASQPDLKHCWRSYRCR